MILARSTGSLGSWAAAGRGTSKATDKTAAAVTIDVRQEFVTGKSPFSEESSKSTILRTRREHLPARKRHDAQKPGVGAVPGSAGFGGDGFAERHLDVALVDVAGSEEAGRRALDRPFLDLVRVALCVDDQEDVRISPVDPGKGARQRDSIGEIEQRGHVVMRPRRTGDEDHCNDQENTTYPAHENPPWTLP